MHLAEDVEVVAVAGSGVDAIEQATSLIPDLVLLDSQLPDMDGATVRELISLVKFFGSTIQKWNGATMELQ